LTPPVALTIAGSDSAGGAGIQADLKTFAALDVFGTSAITALTAQNTVGVSSVHAVPPDFVDAQIEAVLDDLDVRAVKTGMLATAPIIRAVAARAGRRELPNLVVDPVMVAASGDRLLEPDAERAYLDELFPHALVITPNLREAEVLLDRRVVSIDDMAGAARDLASAGPRFVVVKGGHLRDDDAVDVVWSAGELQELSVPRMATQNVHGTGCTFGSAIAAALARGDEPFRAIQSAKHFVTVALQGGASWHLGAGSGPLNHFAHHGRGKLAAHAREPEFIGLRGRAAPTVEPDPGHTGGGS
jgi:hydroxymethylpyrimidine/phosphomethylpyrimidine kinase